MITTASDGTLSWNLSNPGESTLCPDLRAYLGYGKDGLPDHEVWRTAVDSEDWRKALQSMAREDIEASHTLRCTKKDGTQRWLQGRITKADEGQMEVVYHDVSIIMRRLERMDSLAEELVQFSQIISHDLKQPLRTIACYVELLARKYEEVNDAISQKYIDRILGATNTVNNQISDLMQIVVSQHSGIAYEKVSCCDLIFRVENDLTAALEDSGAKIVLSGAEHNVYGDGPLLYNVFSNLINNAVKYRREGVEPVITVSFHDAGEEILCCVGDNGKGIPKSMLETIFKPFKQGVKKNKGVGLGLAIVRRIVNQHGKQIVVESEEGMGSTFSFLLDKPPY